MNAIMKQWGKLTLMEWVLMALLAALNGVATSLLSHLNQLLTSLGGSMLTSTIVGLYMIYGLLAMYIIRKPGAALFTYLIGALMQIMVGTSYGPWSAIAAALCYAVIVEPLFFLVKYKKFDWSMMLFTGVAMTPLWYIVAAFMFGYIHYESLVLVITLAIRCVSGMLLCGGLTKWLGDRLKHTRYVRPFALGREAMGLREKG
ncbi:ECF transporter S component [Paenibacillus aquistagni]|uniref:ECF transporter S component n=1 Tax=Paenibacillus aquistagni TaxID=1852522 RepID=UPI001F109861|nr:ECF transporter S component [Paenibacillus aquistagni]